MISSPQVSPLLNLSFTRKVSKNLPLHLSFFCLKNFFFARPKKKLQKERALVPSPVHTPALPATPRAALENIHVFARGHGRRPVDR